MKKVLESLIIIIVMISLINLLERINNNNYQKAIIKCNGKENVIERYTKEGDKFYLCKVEK